MTPINLVIELEKLFKQEPFNYEVGTLTVVMDRGSIKVLDNDIDIDSLLDRISELEDEIDSLETTIQFKDDYIDILEG